MFIAKNQDGNVVEGGVSVVEEIAGDGTTYVGAITVSSGVKTIDLGASWSANSDLTGEESVTLTVTRELGGLSGVETASDTAKLKENGLNDCPPEDVLPELGFTVVGTGFCASDFGNQVADAGFRVEFKEQLSGEERFDLSLVGGGEGDVHG